MDLKNVLNDDIDEKNNNVRVHKKPIQLRDIENRSSNNHIKINNQTSDEHMKEIINKEKKNIYFKSWNKLDNGLKINRLHKFIETEKETRNLSENNKNKLSKLLLNAHSNNKLNKISDVKYDIDKGEIIEIKILLFDEETKKYSLKIKENKPKTTTKSKTNIERLLSKKK
tara:strand:+ start:103 stop:612 length:510 start_codon:yes stop_codon:yes gene_type:complete